MRKLLFAVSLAAAGAFAFAEGQTYTWTGSVDDDWNKPGNFTVDGETAKSVPGSEDTVILPDGTDLAFDTVSDAASFAVFANVYRISPVKPGSCRVEITVPSKESEAAVNAALTYSQGGKEANLLALGNLLTVVKRGPGTLRFTAIGRFVSSDLDATLNSSFDILAGEVFLPMTFDGSDSVYFGDVHVADGATLHHPSKTASTHRGHYGSLVLDEGGLVTNDLSTTAYLSMHGDSCVRGTLGGNFQINVEGNIRFMDADATYPAANNVQIWSGGVVEAEDFGLQGAPSPLGCVVNFVTRRGSGGLRYLGTGATTTDKRFELWADNTDTFGFIDGGAYGGLNWSGAWGFRTSSKTDYVMQRLVLDGSNTVPCVMSGVIESPSKSQFGNTNYTMRVTKKGSGTWEMRYNPDSDMRGVFAVEEGALRFDNVAETNVNSALGKSTILQEDIAGVPVDPVLYGVDYAFAAGNPNDARKTGVFEYVGATNCIAVTRPFAIRGRGGVANNGGGWLHLKGFSPLGAGTRTLVLGGTNELDNVAEGVTGALDVEKAGSGTWKLTGSQTFTGGISVTGGKLIVERPKYTWFRWTIQQRFKAGGSDSGARPALIDEFALYDADGNRINLGLKDYGSITNSGTSARYYAADLRYVHVFGTDPGPRSLVESESSLDLTTTVRSYGISNGEYLTDLLFDGKSSTFFGCFNGLRAEVGKPQYWVPIIMRLPGDSAEVRYWDYVHNRNDGRGVQVSKLEGSIDGLVWDDIDAFGMGDDDYPRTAHMWQFKQVVFGQEETTDKIGREITARPEGVQDFLTGSRAVSVAAGATLEVRGTTLAVSKLTVDAAAGAGALKGVALDEDGELHVENAPKTGAYDVAIDFTGSDAANAAGWTVYEDGRMKGSRKIAVTPTGLRIEPSGMTLILR